jgi:DNA-binding NtrC family response regulator
MANILIVDDAAEVRANLKKTLEKENHTIFEAQNGIDCLKIIHNNNIDLVILDIFMPEKGGIDTLMEIKSLEIKKIIITGMPLSESDAFYSLINHYGAKKILFKPFKKIDLIEAVSEALKS